MSIKPDTAWLWLNNIRGIGRKSISRLINMFGSPVDIYEASEEVIEETGFLKAVQVQRLSDKKLDNILRLEEQLADKGIRFIHIEHKLYPKRLVNIPDPPYGLYVKYKTDNSFDMFNRPCVAIIGSRNCTDYGYNTAYNIAMELSAYGITIISGMAKGIDGAAQKGALSGGGETCAILGCGVDICYPPENIELYMNIADSGMLMSEYAPGTEPKAGFFPERNRIISGISNIVIVVEAGVRSGSLITSDMALEQGRDVYAVPGRICDSVSAGCNRLIKNGAGIYTEVNDILDELGIEYGDKRGITNVKNNFLAIEEKMLYARLSLLPKHIDELVDETGMSAMKVMEILLELEMKNLVRQTSMNYYISVQHS